MADSKLTFLTEVELPPYCFLSEAVEWVAFGRVPQMQHELERYTDDIVDFRFYWREMPDNWEPPETFPWFDRLEFESLGIEISEEYFQAAEKCYMKSVSDLPTKIAEYEAKRDQYFEHEDGSKVYFYRDQATQAHADLVELGPLQELVDEIEAKFKPHYDVACAKLFQLLALGELTCQSLDLDRWERLCDAGEYQEAAKFVDVPRTAFSLGMDWTKNELLINGAKHGVLRVSTREILDKRSVLLQSGQTISIERFGAFYLSNNARSSKNRRKIGRRSVVDWDRLKARLHEMSLSGTLPEGKENCIYELIAFAESELGKGPSRTAVQRNLGSELDALFAQN